MQTITIKFHLNYNKNLKCRIYKHSNWATKKKTERVQFIEIVARPHQEKTT